MPTVKDFVITENPEEDADGFHAWKSFGGLSVEDAYIKFCECPAGLQEDFMWMGDRAFAFYFPVIDRYVREKESTCEFDGETYILAYDIGMHVPSETSEVWSLYDRILRLCDFVIESLRELEEYENRSRPVREVDIAWRDLRGKIP